MGVLKGGGVSSYSWDQPRVQAFRAYWILGFLGLGVGGLGLRLQVLISRVWGLNMALGFRVEDLR